MNCSRAWAARSSSSSSRALPQNVPKFTAERLRRAVQDLHVVQADQRLQITVSIGLAGCDANIPAPSLDVLLASADQALYRAKAHGRNRVEQAEAQRQVI